MHWYHAIGTHRKSTITDPDLIQKLEEQHSGQTKCRSKEILLVIEMPVAANQNPDVVAGIVNGSYRFLCKIRFFADTEGRRYPKSCVVEIPGTDAVELSHLLKHRFPILPDSTDLGFEHGASRRISRGPSEAPPSRCPPSFQNTSLPPLNLRLDSSLRGPAACRHYCLLTSTDPPERAQRRPSDCSQTRRATFWSLAGLPGNAG